MPKYGYDLSEFLPDTETINQENDPRKRQADLGLKQFLIEHEQEFIPQSPVQGISDLGFKLDKNGHFEFEDGPQYDENRSMDGDIDFRKSKYVREEKMRRQANGENELTVEEITELEMKAKTDVVNQYIGDMKEVREAYKRSELKYPIKDVDIMHLPMEIVDVTLDNPEVIRSETIQDFSLFIYNLAKSVAKVKMPGWESKLDDIQDTERQ